MSWVFHHVQTRGVKYELGGLDVLQHLTMWKYGMSTADCPDTYRDDAVHVGDQAVNADLQ